MNLDRSEDRPQIVLAKMTWPYESFSRTSLAKAAILSLVSGAPGAGKIAGSIQCSLGQIPFLLPIANAFAEWNVHYGEAILDQLVETPQPRVSIVRLLCQIGDPGVDGAGAFGLADHKVFEQGGRPLRRFFWTHARRHSRA